MTEYDELEELRRGVSSIKSAMEDVSRAYMVSPDKVRLCMHPSGAYTIDIEDKPILFFFDLNDLVGWASCR